MSPGLASPGDTSCQYSFLKVVLLLVAPALKP